jgi:hypothetical protein
MNFRPTILALAVSLCFAHSARAQLSPYIDGGAGGNELGFSSIYYHADGGIDYFHDKLFAEGEGGWDSQNPMRINNGNTFRAHGLGMWQIRHWLFAGGGVHYSRVSTSVYHIQGPWPVAAFLMKSQTGRLRLNSQYLFSTEPYMLQGPLFDLRVRLWQNKHWYYRERLGIYRYRDPLDPPPIVRHHGIDLGFSLLYVFRDNAVD